MQFLHEGDTVPKKLYIYTYKYNYKAIKNLVQLGNLGSLFR